MYVMELRNPLLQLHQIWAIKLPLTFCETMKISRNLSELQSLTNWKAVADITLIRFLP